MDPLKLRERPIKRVEKPLEEEVLRILCLHGYRQNGNAFRAKIGSIRKHLSKYAEFVFITAPHTVPSPPSSDNEQSNGDAKTEEADKESAERSWWFNNDDGTFRGTNKNGPAFGFDESLRLVEEAWQTMGPFHGILGFSQGACFVGLICSLSARGMTVIKPQFAVLAAGFRSGSLAHMNYYEELVSIPSIHIAGRGDAIIPYEMSFSLSSTFEDPIMVSHPGGHYFAANAEQKRHYVEFFRRRLVEHLERRELEREDAVVIIDPLDGIPSTSAASADMSDSD